MDSFSRFLFIAPIVQAIGHASIDAIKGDQASVVPRRPPEKLFQRRNIGIQIRIIIYSMEKERIDTIGYASGAPSPPGIFPGLVICRLC